MSDTPASTLDDSPREENRDPDRLTSLEVDGILRITSEDVQVLTHQHPSEMELSEGVVSVDQAVVSRDRDRKYVDMISPDFRIAVLRLQHRSADNDPATDTVRLEIPLADRDDLKIPGKHNREHDSEVFIFNPDGSVREGYLQTAKIFYKFADHPKGNSSTEVVRTADITADKLSTQARSRLADLRACV